MFKIRFATNHQSHNGSTRSARDMATLAIRALFSVASLTLALLMFTPSANAFCVYNETKDRINYQEETNALSGAMEKTIAAGGKECCNWKDSGCNPAGKQTSVIEASIRTDYTTRVLGKSGPMCGIFVQGEGALVKHTAGGYLIVKPTTKE